jgi:WD40 repeat protein
VWEVGTSSKAVLKGTLKYGVSHLSFSNDGKKLVAIGMDADHCIVVFDVEKAISNRGSGKKDDYLIAAGKGPRNDVFDVKFDKVDKNIILACRNEVYFATYDQFSIKAVKGLWDAKTCPFSSVTCIGTVETNVITGTFKG